MHYTFSEKGKSFADNMFEFCEVQDWKWGSMNNASSEGTDHPLSSQKATPGELITPDVSDDISVIRVVSLGDPRMLRGARDETFSENNIEITNPTGNAVWENDSPGNFSSLDPFQSLTKKRGRPKKSEDTSSHLIESNSSHTSPRVTFIKRSRGRPRIHPPSSRVRSPPTSNSNSPRRRGRPRKNFLGERYLSKQKQLALENADYVIGMDII